MRRSLSTLVLAFVTSLALASPVAAKTLVRFDRSGGIAGIQTTMTITDGGGATVKGSVASATRHSRLSKAQLRTLRQALRDARFSTLRARYAPRVHIADGFTRTVRYAGRSVTVEDGATPPARLDRLLQRLERLASPR